MFSDIEREYKKALQQNRFFAYYWPKVILVVIIAVICDLALGVNRWMVYGCLVLLLVVLVGLFFVREFYVAHRTIKQVHESKGIIAKVQAYIAADDALRIRNLAIDLAHHGIHTKADLELALGYYQSCLPGNSRPNLLEWVLTAAVAVSSVIIVAYDDAMGTIDTKKLISVFGSTLAVALIILTPFIIAKLISASISRSRNKIDTSIVEDLSYICVHFEQFRPILEKNIGRDKSA